LDDEKNPQLEQHKQNRQSTMKMMMINKHVFKHVGGQTHSPKLRKPV